MQRNNSKKIISSLSILFFVSGVSALIYQIAWQRLLFSVLGSDIESVTIIVSVFMLGLGIGALIGGKIVDSIPERAVMLFAFIEVSIGVFGIFSKPIIMGVNNYFYSESSFLTALISFSIILFPTIFMGSTLPILVSFVARKWTNVGAATGHMYSFNTLGAASGAFITGYWLFDMYTLTASIYFAAAMNIGIAFLSLTIIRSKNA